MARKLVAGVDCSTQSIKVIVVDAESGELVASGRRANTVHRDGPASETDPEDWWQGLAEALALTGVAAHIDAISIAAQQLGLVTLDAHHRPVRRAVLWDDTRSADAAIMLRDLMGGPAGWAEHVETQPLAGMTVCSWAWLKAAEPQSADATAHIRLPHDFLTERLTRQGTTDRGDASGTGWWSTRREGYVNEVLSHVGIDEDMLPRVLGPDSIAGEVVTEAAVHCGLRSGIPVACGTGDNMAAALALATEPGTPVISLGTSGTAYVRSDLPFADPSGQIIAGASASGEYLPLTCTLNATLAVDNLARLFGLERDAVAETTRVVTMPYLSGERLPNYPLARGTIAGIGHDTEPGEILLAAYEGVAYSLVRSLDILHSHSSGIDPDAPIILIGGGARGKVWQRTILRLSGRGLIVPECDELVAWGAATQAGSLLLNRPAVAVARQWNILRGRQMPAMDRDDEAMERIACVRTAAHELNAKGMC